MPQVANRFAGVLSAVALGALTSVGAAQADVVKPQPAKAPTVTPHPVAAPSSPGSPAPAPGPAPSGSPESRPPRSPLPAVPPIPSGPRRGLAPAPASGHSSGGPTPKGTSGPPRYPKGLAAPDDPSCGLGCQQAWLSVLKQQQKAAEEGHRPPFMVEPLREAVKATEQRIKELGAGPGRAPAGAPKLQPNPAGQKGSSGTSAGAVAPPAASPLKGGGGDDGGNLFASLPSLAKAAGASAVAAVEAAAKDIAKGLAAALVPMACSEKKADDDGVTLCPK